MKVRRDLRKGVFVLLAMGVAARFYFAQELLAVLALFTVAFIAVASVILSLHLSLRVCAAALARVVGQKRVRVSAP